MKKTMGGMTLKRNQLRVRAFLEVRKVVPSLAKERRVLAR